MVKLIKKGGKGYTRCSVCGSKFTYEPEDVHSGLCNSVKCPYCESFISVCWTDKLMYKIFRRTK